MARNEWISRLMDQIVEIDMALITATVSEMDTLEALRRDLVSQLDTLKGQPHKLAA